VRGVSEKVEACGGWDCFALKCFAIWAGVLEIVQIRVCYATPRKDGMNGLPRRISRWNNQQRRRGKIYTIPTLRTHGWTVYQEEGILAGEECTIGFVYYV
jgi:hypothetical protein